MLANERTREQLNVENAELRRQLEEAKAVVTAIWFGKIHVSKEDGCIRDAHAPTQEFLAGMGWGLRLPLA